MSDNFSANFCWLGTSCLAILYLTLTLSKITNIIQRTSHQIRLPRSGKTIGKLSIYCIYKSKGEVHPRTGHEGSWREQRYSSTLSLTSALERGGWSTQPLGLFTLGKEAQCPLCRKLGGPQNRSGWVRKITPPLGFDSRTVQPVASRYTDYAIPTLYCLHSKTYWKQQIFSTKDSAQTWGLAFKKHPYYMSVA